MNVGKFMKLSSSEKAEVNLRNIKTFCSLCGAKVDGESYCFGCHTFVCQECEDSPEHVCVGAKQMKRVSKKQSAELRKRAKLKQELIEKSGGRCERCLQLPDWRGLSLHHLKLLSQGGETEVGNATLLCFRCHSLSHNIVEKD